MCVLALLGVHALHAHTHDDCTAHIMFCAARPIHVCCKAPSVLQSTAYYVLQRYCLCCKATDSDTSAVLTDAAWYVQCHKDCDLLQLSARLCWMYL